MISWEDNVHRVTPYVPGEQPNEKNVIKLNTNENPYPPSPNVVDSIRNIDIDGLRKYPDPSASLLVNAIADFHNINSKNVFVGVGSDDVIGMAFMTFFQSGKKIIFPDITYSFYPVWADMMGIPYEKKSLDDNYNLVEKDYLCENGGIIFPNPNAPTGILVKKSFIIDILNANPYSVVIIDEAYIDFAEESDSVIDLTAEYENLLVTRTFSKSRSLAGLRIGYAVGNEKLIKYMNDIKYSYNSYTMNTPSIILGKASISDKEYFNETIKHVKCTREWFSKELEKNGFKVLESSANFVFASPSKKSAKEVFEKARENGIYFRYFAQERIDNFLRITIGVDEDMKKVIEFLREIDA